MNKEELEKRFLEEKKVNLIDVLEINNKKYAKTMIIFKDSDFKIEYKYFEIENGLIKEIDKNNLEEIISLFQNDYGNVIY